MLHKSLFFLLFFVSTFFADGQDFKFAHVSDTHIGSANADEDLRRTVSNINADTSIRFVILTGDITDFGADEELLLAKRILDSLNKPWHIIPGNHDANWSESGTNSFKRIFGNETFNFQYGGYLFLGTVCGPNMRMSPGQVSRENIVWLDSVLKNMKDKNMPIIFANHYPQDTSLNNWYEVIDRLKTRNTQLIICGHGHSNHPLNFEGIPAVMGRSNLRAKNPVGGYNIVTIKDGKATYEERNPLTNESRIWNSVSLVRHNYKADSYHYYRPDYSVNDVYGNVKVKWSFQDNSDIGSGIAIGQSKAFVSDSKGTVFAQDLNTGKKLWTFQTKGKIYSTPLFAHGLIVVGSSDYKIYCLNAKNGKLVWTYTANKPVLGNPVIDDSTVYIGASDGHFRSLNLYSGRLNWDFDQVKGFVVDKPLIYRDKVYFGSWGTEFYALDAKTGSLAWKWNNGSANRMFSPAACFPVATDNKIFIVAPDRYMTVFNAQTGEVIWRKQDAKNRVRESMGLSVDSTLVYAKTMDGDVIGVSTKATGMEIPWRSDTRLSYEIAPTAIVASGDVVYVPSNSGVVTAVSKDDGRVLWKHKISNCLITCITIVTPHEVIATTMDGKVAYLKF